ncbi:MAG: sugar transferase [Bacteroidetes bacterium]|nr:sugar transferase [Bacteroidota bacterium]
MKNAETLEYLPIMMTHVDPFEGLKADKSLLKSAQKINKNFFKRGFDIFLSLCLFIFFFSWIFPLVFLIILLDTGWPVFFIQDRIGKNGKVFRFFKFRTMEKQVNEHQFIPTQVGDKRITKTGKFLRNSNIDELPQFINIIKGEMSLVGPRPAAMAFHKKYEEMLGKDLLQQREIIKPGIIGLSQVRGFRGDLINEQENKAMIKARIQIDLIYIKRWSNWLDIKIIGATFRNMLKRLSGL